MAVATIGAAQPSPAQKKETPMSQNKFPDGWDESRVQRVLAHHAEQTEAETLVEDKAGIESSTLFTSGSRGVMHPKRWKKLPVETPVPR